MTTTSTYLPLPARISFVRSFVMSVKYHPDSTCILSGSADKSIKLWDVRTHQLIQHYPAHDDAVTSVSLHPVRTAATARPAVR